ncbi:MAG: PQQ-like beta-propeller repeat protein [Verrucomicrobia bacterium]|nr:PQQ-like beta-propeller repeat protein [Verrucomicrobiota bacterium]
MNTRTLATVSLFTTLAASALFAGDWPQWQGPNRDGISAETALLKLWPTDGPKLVWTTRALGGGYSTPSVAGGRIYGMSYRGEDEVVWALDASSGKEVWVCRTGGKPSGVEKKIGYNDGSRSSPTVDGDALYVVGTGGDVSCVGTADGKLRWHKNLASDFGGRMMSGWGFSESPLVDGAKLICTPGGAQGTLLALDKKTGAKLWQTAEVTDAAAYASVVVAELFGKRQYIQFTGASVFGVDAANGKLLWRAPRPGKTAVIPTPIVFDNHVFVTSGYGIGCNLFKISMAGGKFTATEVYANTDMKNHHGGVVRVGNHLYGINDPRFLTCMDFKTGKVVWENESVGKGSVTFADGHLYVRSEGGKGGGGAVALVEATPTGYKETGRFQQPNRSNKNSWPHPVIANGRLYLRDQDVLLCYDVKDKKQR